MKDGIQKLDVTILNTVISAGETGGVWRRALELLVEMKESVLKPDVIKLNTAMRACHTVGVCGTEGGNSDAECAKVQCHDE